MQLHALCFAALMACSTASGGHVYHVSPAGDDRGEGSRTSPWKTVQRAADAVKPGDTVFIQTGTYREKVQVRSSGTAAAPIDFTAAEGARPVLSASELLSGPWKNHGGGLFSCPLPQRRDVPGWLFIDGAHASHALLHSPAGPRTFALGLLGPRWDKPPVGADVQPNAGDTSADGARWQTVKASAGTVDLVAIFAGKQKDSLVFLHTYIYSPADAPGSLRFPQASRQPATNNSFYGMYRLGYDLAGMPQFMKVWVNGKALSEWEGGYTYKVTGLNLKKGWNSVLVMLFADARGPWRLQAAVTSNGRGGIGKVKLFCQAAKPADFNAAPANDAANALAPNAVALPKDSALPGDPGGLPAIGEWLAAGPFPDQPDGRLYVRLPSDDSPQKHQMEWGSRDAVFSIGRDVEHIQLSGLTVRHAASRAQGSAIEAGPYTAIDGCTVEENLGNGVRIASYCTVRNSKLLRNGCTGLSGARATDVQILNNDLIGNNWLLYDNDWHSGGLKFLFMTNTLIRGNRAIDNESWGIWLDTGIVNARVEGNYCRNNRSAGIFLEISRGKNVIANNVCLNTRPWVGTPRSDGIYMHDTSGALVAHNLCSGNARFGISINLVTDRILAEGGISECSNNTILNNVSLGNGVAGLRMPAGQPRQTGNRSDYNVLAPVEKDGSFGQMFLGPGNAPFLSLVPWQKLGFDRHSVAATALFRKGAQSEFLPAAGSPAIGLCPVLEDVPADFDGKPRHPMTTAGPFEYEP